MARGELIGFVGSTGRSTGAHLHFELLNDGKPVNPIIIQKLQARRSCAVPSSSASASR